DINNNGFLDQNDFQCMAVRACVVEGKGDCSPARLEEYRKLMKNLWDEISDIADDDKAMRAFIESNFKLLDIDNDGTVGVNEYRYNCISRVAIDDIAPIDKAFETLLNDDDKKRGGLSLDRYKELYAQFLGNTADNHPAVNLFGPL
ncbi:hypothetical protein KR215_003873, partial [Drosophila sulfurigaster]